MTDETILSQAYPVRTYCMKFGDYIESLVTNMYQNGYEEKDNMINIFDNNGLVIFSVSILHKELLMKLYNEKWNALNPKNKV